MKENSLAIAFSMISFMVTVIWGGPLLRVLRHLRIGKLIRVEGPDRHSTKMGTPTMGGIMFILPVVVITAMLNAVELLGGNFRSISKTVLVPILVMLAFGLLGAIDDWEGIRGPRRGLGMRARTKFLLQIGVAILIAYFLKYNIKVPNMYWPGVWVPFDLGNWYLPIAVFIIVAMSNAVNLTDGLDGLAGLIAATAFAIYGAISIYQGEVLLGRLCFTVVGSLFGFLWFNVHPAQLFMGDTGSLALGALLAVVALMTGQWLVLPLIAIIPVSETISVIIQVVHFKLSKGKRFFKMAPLHHHFELEGWSETQVVQRFWLISLLFGMLGIAITFV